MDEKDLASVLQKHPDVIEDSKRLIGILKDYFPAERQNVRLLEQALEINVLQEIRTRQLGKPLLLRLRKRLMDEFFLQQDKADWAAAMWSYAYGYGVLGKVMPSLEEQSAPQSANPTPQAVQKPAASAIPPVKPKTDKIIVTPRPEDAKTLYLRGQRFLSSKDIVQAAKLFREAANLGYAEAQNQLGWCYEKGVGVAQDSTQAAFWYRKAAEQGDEKAQYSLALAYHNGRGVEQDYASAFAWFLKLAEKGNVNAQYWVGCYYLSDSGKQYDSQAVEWLQKAAEQGHAEAQYCLGWYYENRWDPRLEIRRQIEQRYTGHPQARTRIEIDTYFCIPSSLETERAAKYYRKAAEQGHAEAQYRLGMVTGEEKWLRVGAEQGHEDAQDELVAYYYHNLDKGTDTTRAVLWFRKLAERNEPYALAGIGRCYFEGWGVKQDHAQAVSWWCKATSAATKGKHYDLTDIQFRLGECYENGLGVLPDCAQAAIWYQKAATSKAQSKAQYRLGLLYYEGRGVKQDYAQAVICWESAVRYVRSNPPPFYAQAAFYLGECHEKGLGVKQDSRAAARWYRSAAMSGHAQAAYRLAALYEKNHAGGVCYVGKFGRTKEDHLDSAAEWYRKAAELGVDDAQQALKRVERKIRWRW